MALAAQCARASIKYGIYAGQVESLLDSPINKRAPFELKLVPYAITRVTVDLEATRAYF
jgi:hypothetical protein